MIVDVNAIKTAIDWLEEYRNDKSVECPLTGKPERMDPEDFLTDKFSKGSWCEITADNTAELFFTMLKYESLFDMILKDYYDSRKQRFPKIPTDSALTSVFLYYGIIELNSDTFETVLDLLKQINFEKAVAVAGYLKKQNILCKVFEMATTIWDIEYVRELLHNLINDPMQKKLYEKLSDFLNAEKESKRKKPTKPIEFQFTQRKKSPKKEVPKIEEPDNAEKSESSSSMTEKIFVVPVPRSTYIKPKETKKLEEDKLKNRELALNKYEQAQKYSFRVANLQKSKKEEEVEEVQQKQPRPKKAPTFKEPSIQPKKTATVILREGARLMKIEQDEIKRLDDIIRGAFNSESLKAFEKDIQEEWTRKEMEEIEKKHLQGLLTYEEALIAKQKYLKRMKESADEFRKEKELWTKQLEEWKEEEQARIRESVEKGKLHEKGVKEAVEHVKEERKRIAMETMEESRALKERWLAEKGEELKRKIQLIKEIKALQAFGVIRRKENLQSISANIGLLCEMSTEELKERLVILRMEVKEEVERRREEIRQKKECRKAIVEGYKDLIEQHQEIRWREKQREELAVKKPKSPVKSSSVEALKKKLYEKRKERLERVS